MDLSMTREERARPSCPTTETSEMDKEFQFLRKCASCPLEVSNPKLLPCFHSLCTECLQKSKEMASCIFCQSPLPQDEELKDHLVFSTLQANLSIYRQILERKELLCAGSKYGTDNECGTESKFWCLTCEVFLCQGCYLSHPKFAEYKSHRVCSLEEIPTKTSKEFLLWNKKHRMLPCHREEHKNQILVSYCNQCQQFFCSSCMPLNRTHSEKRCYITEIQQRLQELTEENRKECANLNEAIEEKKRMCEDTKAKICGKMKTIEQILQKMETLLVKTEEQHEQEVQDEKMKIQDMENALKKITSAKQMVEAMSFSSSDQDIMEMHPIIQNFLEDLRQTQPPSVGPPVHEENFVEIRKELEALFRSVAGVIEDDPPRLEMKKHPGKAPTKRKHVTEERATENSQKVIRSFLEANEGMAEPISQKEPGTSSQSAGKNLATENTSDPEEGVTSYQCGDSSSSTLSPAGSLLQQHPSVVMNCTFQDSQSTPGRVPSSTFSSLAECNKPGLSSRQLDFHQEEVNAAGNPCTEPLVLAQEANVEDLHCVQEGECCNPTPFLHAQSSQPRELLLQCMLPLSTEPEHQMCRGATQNAFHRICEQFHTLNKQIENVMAAIKDKDVRVENNFERVEHLMCSLFRLVTDGTASVHDRRAQLSPSVQEFPVLASTHSGMDRRAEMPGRSGRRGYQPSPGHQEKNGRSPGETSHATFNHTQELDVQQETVVFFDMKLLSQDVIHLVAEDTSSFSVTIMPKKREKNVLYEIGLEPFLDYLQSLHKPILVGYRIWSMGLLVLAKALKNIKKEEQFKASIIGFLDVLPLLKDKIPNLDSYTLSDLVRMYLDGQFCDTGPSGGAKILKKLCAVLEINPIVIKNAVVPYSILQFSPPSNSSGRRHFSC